MASMLSRATKSLLFLPPAPESDSDFRREPENSDYHELENLIFNQRAYCTKRHRNRSEFGEAA
jgi:hypothetical protein